MFSKEFRKAGTRELEDLLQGFVPQFIPSRPLGTRPCTVDGAPALFHRFVENDRGVLQINTFCHPSQLETILKNFKENNFTDSTCSIEKFRETMALIEWPDGRLSTVAVERVQFTDRED